MINLGTLYEVAGHTFLYSGNLTLGDKKFFVCAFETNKKDGKRSFYLRAADGDSEIQTVIDSLVTSRDNNIKKKVAEKHIQVDDSHLTPSKGDDIQTTLF
jgi:hypothetical protein